MKPYSAGAGGLLVLCAFCLAALPDGDSLLAHVDANAFAQNKVVFARMTIHGRRSSRTISTMSYISGTDRAFTEYLAPERDRGTKMLKLGKELWIYSPESDRIIKLSSHMLRQPVSGSDLSYEDMLEDPRLTSQYCAQTTGLDTILARPAWKLELTAKKPDVAYSRRTLWIDKELHLVLREDRFSRSGILLKTLEAKSLRRVDGRWVADRVIFRDALKQSGGTEIVLDSIRFNAQIPAFLFSKAALRK